MRLLAFAGLLALTISAHADLAVGAYAVAVNGPPNLTFTGGMLRNGFASIPNVGIVTLNAYLTPTTVNFSFGASPTYGPPNPSLQVNTVSFEGRTADYITSFKLDPASTITGIVPSSFVMNTIIAPGNPPPFISYTNINFDFSNANPFPGGTAIFDLTFAPQASAPEIDPSLATSGLILLAGTITILRTRRRTA